MTPVLDPGVDYVDGYFPEGVWYDYFTVRLGINELIKGKKKGFSAHMYLFSPQGDSVRSKGEELRLDAPLDKINVHLREGSVVPTQVNGIYLKYIKLFE